jgi:hypothetical protein
MAISYLYEGARRANARTRALVSHYGFDPVEASRVYFLCAVARCIGLLTSRDRADFERGERLIQVNALVLDNLFPNDPLITGELSSARVDSGAAEAVNRFLQRRQGDGAHRSRIGAEVPPGKLWRSLENRPALRPGWGSVEPFALSSARIRETCQPPPAVGSPEHLADLERVRATSGDIDHEGLAIALRWACSVGSEAPAGQWQTLLESELGKTGDYEDALFVLSVAEIAMFNAGIACWKTKFDYWYPRPSNMDAKIDLHIHLPNFPSFTSGHSSFSWSAVTAVCHYRPELRDDLSALAAEASWSRVLAGVHYPFDCDAGMSTGQTVGEATAARLPNLQCIVELATNPSTASSTRS